jgi:hypothetical protein
VWRSLGCGDRSAVPSANVDHIESQDRQRVSVQFLVRSQHFDFFKEKLVTMTACAACNPQIQLSAGDTFAKSHVCTERTQLSSCCHFLHSLVEHL